MWLAFKEQLFALCETYNFACGYEHSDFQIEMLVQNHWTILLLIDRLYGLASGAHLCEEEDGRLDNAVVIGCLFINENALVSAFVEHCTRAIKFFYMINLHEAFQKLF